MNKDRVGGRRGVPLLGLGILLGLAMLAGRSAGNPYAGALFSETYQAIFRQAEQDRISGDFERAAGRFEAALKIAEEAHNPAGEAECLAKLGLLHWNQGRVSEAMRCFERARHKAEARGKGDSGAFSLEALRIIGLYNSGKDFRQSNRCPESIATFNKALEISRKIGSDDFSVKCLRQLSLTFWQMNDLKAFRTCNEEALIIARKMNFRKEEGRCLNNIGLSHWKSANYSAALRCFQNALISIKNSMRSQIEAELFSNIGIIYKELGDFIKASEYFEKALVIDKELNAVDAIPIDLINIGASYRGQSIIMNSSEWLHKALQFYEECLRYPAVSKDRQLKVALLNNIGTIYTDLKNYNKALSLFLAAFQDAEKGELFEEIAFLNANLGEVYLREGKVNLSIDRFKKSINLAQSHIYHRILWEAHYGLGRCYENMGEYEKALSCYEESAGIIDKIRSRIFLDSFKSGFTRNKIAVYESMLNVLYMTGAACPKGFRLEKMFSVIERAKARAFLEGLGEARIDIKENLPPDLSRREGELTKEISGIYSELAGRELKAPEKKARLERLIRAEDEYLRLISDIKLAAPDVASLVAPDILALPDVQQGFLDDQTALIEYFLGEERSYVFLVTRKKARIMELGSRSLLERSLRGYLRIIMSPENGEASGFPAGERIADEILTPVLNELDGTIKKLIVVPDGILYYLPFESLRIPATRGEGREYLIERSEISYAPSVSSLAFLAGRKMGVRPMSILAIGDPAVPNGSQRKPGPANSGSGQFGEIYQGQNLSFRPLPYSRKEAEAAVKFFPKRSRRTLVGREAREDLLKRLPLKEYKILHFACHGLIDENAPFRSALVLSSYGAPSEDGFLQAREIYALKTSADLVVLSACRTGKGRMEKGEGILGLARMFFYSGSISVLSTLWSIEDRSASVFMEKFYRYLARGGGKAEALRLAKLDMLASKFRHPFHWAAFVLNGHSGRAFGETIH